MEDSTRSLKDQRPKAGLWPQPISSEYSLDTPNTLPDHYGDHRLVLLPRDPLWFFAYWEVATEALTELQRQHNFSSLDESGWMLRVYDVTDTPIDPAETAPSMDLPLSPTARQWYVKVGRSGRQYWARLVLRLKDGRMITVLTSNRIRLPVGRISEELDSRWMALGENKAPAPKWQEFLEATQATNVGAGSSENSQTMTQRWEFLKSIYSGSWVSSGPSSSSVFSAPLDGVPSEEKK